MFGIFPLCLCNSIGGCISKTGHLDTPVMLERTKTRGDQRAHSSSFLIHLIISAPPSTSAEHKTHFAFLLPPLPSPFTLSTALCQCIPFCQTLSWMGPRSLPSFGILRLPLCNGCTYRMFLCSTETQKSSPLSRPTTHPSAMPCSQSS